MGVETSACLISIQCFVCLNSVLYYDINAQYLLLVHVICKHYPGLGEGETQHPNKGLVRIFFFLITLSLN